VLQLDQISTKVLSFYYYLVNLLFDVNGNESSRTHLPINVNLTLKEVDKFDIVVQEVEGSSSSHPVYKDEIKD
jgi:hypothetical protein